jgi:antitoxin (DNA-binding transcriptional repressor) of toxin-antitoxin stability system
MGQFSNSGAGSLKGVPQNASLACVLHTCYMKYMKTLNLRDANQQFSKLVREIEATGETVLVLRDGKPAIRMMPAEEKPRRFSAEQQKAIEELIDSMRNNPGRSEPDAPHLTRDEMHER